MVFSENLIFEQVFSTIRSVRSKLLQRKVLDVDLSLLSLFYITFFLGKPGSSGLIIPATTAVTRTDISHVCLFLDF